MRWHGTSSPTMPVYLLTKITKDVIHETILSGKASIMSLAIGRRQVIIIV